MASLVCTSTWLHTSRGLRTQSPPFNPPVGPKRTHNKHIQTTNNYNSQLLPHGRETVTYRDIYRGNNQSKRISPHTERGGSKAKKKQKIPTRLLI
uniref:Putative secreted protein n=1 Tax=Anopheles darlingi TaxID=43151 RepID=A0A2M4D7T1_ANODA